MISDTIKVSMIHHPPVDIMLTLKNLQIERHQHRLFPPINLHCHAGQAWQILGPNGSGKSSLLKALAGLSRPRRGLIQWRGTSVSQLVLRHHSLYLSHELCLKAALTVQENLHLYAALHDIPLSQLEPCLRDFDLEALAQRPIASLSAGQQRRVNLAKCGLSTSQLWLLDEPFTALDQEQCLKLSHRIKACVARGGLVLFTSHQALDFTALQCQSYHLDKPAT